MDIHIYVYILTHFHFHLLKGRREQIVDVLRVPGRMFIGDNNLIKEYIGRWNTCMFVYK